MWNKFNDRIVEYEGKELKGTLTAEDEFLFRGGLVCPKCKQGLHTLGTDYRRMGLLYKCRGCEQIFNQPVIKWRCLKCSSMTDSSQIIELDASSYALNE